MIKKFLLVILLFFVPILMPEGVLAGPVVALPPGGGVSIGEPPIQDIIDPAGIRDTTYFKLCQIRLMFCTHHKLALVLIASVVFAMGFLILTGKAKWSFIVTTSVGMVIFLSAEYVMKAITMPPPGLGVYWACTCINL